MLTCGGKSISLDGAVLACCAVRPTKDHTQHGMHRRRFVTENMQATSQASYVIRIREHSNMQHHNQACCACWAAGYSNMLRCIA